MFISAHSCLFVGFSAYMKDVFPIRLTVLSGTASQAHVSFYLSTSPSLLQW